MANNHQVDVATGAGHGTLKSYIVGFILSIVLTIIPYLIVVDHMLIGNALLLTVVGLAVLQLLVQLVFFLHLSTASEQRWNLMTFMFTILILIILVVGTLWIMWNLNYNMMDH
ncbi:MAG: cytochrome o ubiquinol oxidase subunit IV [Burkholderiales bacterium]